MLQLPPSLRAVDVAAAAPAAAPAAARPRELPLRTIYAPHEKMFIGAKLSEREAQFMVRGQCQKLQVSLVM